MRGKDIQTPVLVSRLRQQLRSFAPRSSGSDRPLFNPARDLSSELPAIAFATTSARGFCGADQDSNSPMPNVESAEQASAERSEAVLRLAAVAEPRIR